MSDDTILPFGFPAVGHKKLVAAFAGGRIVEANAEKGTDLLREILETDEGARHLGEVALVPESSPIAKSGLLFHNMLYDENAASHVAIGQAYSPALPTAQR